MRSVVFAPKTLVEVPQKDDQNGSNPVLSSTLWAKRQLIDEGFRINARLDDTVYEQEQMKYCGKFDQAQKILDYRFILVKQLCDLLYLPQVPVVKRRELELLTLPVPRLSEDTIVILTNVFTMKKGRELMSKTIKWLHPWHKAVILLYTMVKTDIVLLQEGVEHATVSLSFFSIYRY